MTRRPATAARSAALSTKIECLPDFDRLAGALRTIASLRLETNVPLAAHTRFGIGGPADFFGWTDDPQALASTVRACREAGAPCYAMGDGSNVVASDAGFRGLVLRFTAEEVAIDGETVEAGAGARLQTLVDSSIEHGLEGLHTLTGIPGSVGGAVYGNAGAYGNSIDRFIERIDYFDGAQVRSRDNAACEFAYRESVFKRRKDWVILGCVLRLPAGDRRALRRRAREIRATRDEKFPPTMLCAGSIFKNLHIRNLPAAAAAAVPRHAVREGKVASAYFLEKVGAKGMRNGGIAIASYHANLLYNCGGGTAAEVRALIDELKSRIRKRYGFEVEEEVQYIG